MKIAHILGAAVAGGAEKLVFELAKLQASIHDVHVVILTNKTDDVGQSWMRNSVQAGISIYVRDESSMNLKCIGWYRKIITNIKPDIVHTHLPSSDIVQLFTANKNYYRLKTIHSTVFSVRHLIAMILNRHDQYIAVSNSIREKFYRLFENIDTIKNGVQYPVQLTRPASEMITFISIGSMRGNTAMSAPKAHDVIIKSWISSRLGDLGHQLLLVGDGKNRAEYENLANNAPGITFLGNRSDVFDLLSKSDVFVMPSRYEGHPISALEAAGMGLYCLFSDIEPLLEIDYKYKSHCRVNDVGGLSELMVEALRSCREVKESEVIRFRQDNSLMKTYEAYESVYSNAKH